MKKDCIQIRRDLHKIPELDKQLPKTLSYLQKFLNRLSCKIIEPANSSLCAYFDFQQSHTLAFRADMDALPIQEHTQLAYASKHEGCMHACGHDGHMAMVLDFAQFVSQLASCSYNILLIFQPAEETTGGAKAICDSHILDDVNTIAVFGLHLWPSLEKNVLAIKDGPLMARSSEVHLHLYGKSTHIATYQKGIDTLNPAINLVQKIYHKFPGNERYLLKFGFCQSGTAPNSISDYTLIKGSLRTFNEQDHTLILQTIKQFAKKAETKSKCQIQLHTTQGYPSLINDANLYQRLTSSYPMKILSNANFLTDDFSYYTLHYPGIYCYLGTGKDIPLHSDHFDFDEQTLLAGVAFYKHLITLSYD